MNRRKFLYSSTLGLFVPSMFGMPPVLRQRMFGQAKKHATTLGYSYYASHFENTTPTYITRATNWSGLENSKLLLMSFWIRNTADGVTYRILANTGLDIQYSITSANKFAWNLYSGDAAQYACSGSSTATNITTGVWRHVMLCIDTSDQAKCLCNVSDTTGLTLSTINNDNIKHNVTNYRFNWATSAANFDLCEFWFGPGQYLDVTDPAIVAKFRQGGKPVSLGVDGSLPTGTAPILYHRFLYTSPLSNSGSGGDLSAINGALTESTTP